MMKFKFYIFSIFIFFQTKASESSMPESTEEVYWMQDAQLFKLSKYQFNEEKINERDPEFLWSFIAWGLNNNRVSFIRSLLVFINPKKMFEILLIATSDFYYYPANFKVYEELLEFYNKKDLNFWLDLYFYSEKEILNIKNVPDALKENFKIFYNSVKELVKHRLKQLFPNDLSQIIEKIQKIKKNNERFEKGEIDFLEFAQAFSSENLQEDLWARSGRI